VKLTPFQMERWQSTYEHRVRYNLSESGVHPLTLSELLALAGAAPDSLLDVRLGYGQSNGSDALRARVAALYPGATDANVLVTVGGAEANFACAWQLIEPGDKVAVMLPNYMQIPGLTGGFGAQVLPFHLRAEDGWRPDLDALEQSLRSGARVILVTNPNNPTGRVLPPDAADRIVELAEHHGAWIVADEVYRGAELDGPETPSFWGRTHRVLATNSLSKAYGIPGLRLGWVVGPPEVVSELWGRTDYTTITPATLSDHLAVLALEPRTREKILQRTRAIIRGNLGALTDWLDARPELFRYTPPDAGAICWIHYDAPVRSTALAEKLRAQKDVLIVPGDHFGVDRCMRIGFGPPREELLAALGRVAEAFEEILAHSGHANGGA
jgi:aspartate/methionine/tyrosine aminotransferase